MVGMGTTTLLRVEIQQDKSQDGLDQDNMEMVEGVIHHHLLETTAPLHLLTPTPLHTPTLPPNRRQPSPPPHTCTPQTRTHCCNPLQWGAHTEKITTHKIQCPPVVVAPTDLTQSLGAPDTSPILSEDDTTLHINTNFYQTIANFYGHFHKIFKLHNREV